MLDIDVELLTSGVNSIEGHTLAEIRVEIVEEEEESDNALEVKDEPPVCPISLVVDKALKIHQQVTPFCEKGNEMREVLEKINAYALIMKRGK